MTQGFFSFMDVFKDEIKLVFVKLEKLKSNELTVLLAMLGKAKTKHVV